MCFSCIFLHYILQQEVWHPAVHTHITASCLKRNTNARQWGKSTWETSSNVSAMLERPWGESDIKEIFLWVQNKSLIYLMAIAVAVIQGNAPVIFKKLCYNRFSPLPLANGCLYDTGCLFSLFTGHSQKTRSCTQWVYSTRPGHFLTKLLNTSDQDLITGLFMAVFLPSFSNTAILKVTSLPRQSLPKEKMLQIPHVYFCLWQNMWEGNAQDLLKVQATISTEAFVLLRHFWGLFCCSCLFC